ncbi:MAG: BREX-1 system adenine-specific DNA-methyltransferase PglX [Christensenellales bacterium]
MDKPAIKKFAVWARNKLIADTKYRAGLVGVTETAVVELLPQSNETVQFFDVGLPQPYRIEGDAVTQRQRFVAELNKETAKQGSYTAAYQTVVDKVAYTWFNRLIAVRYMEVNDLLPSRTRVLSSADGRAEPQIVTSPFDAVLDYTPAEQQQIVTLKNDNKLDEAFQLLFLKQCAALGDCLPRLFEQVDDYMPLLLALSFTDKDGVVCHLVNDIPESDWLEEDNKGGAVQIVGWLYQYYNTEPKEQVFANLKKNIKISAENIPAATQLFTPDWIVRYMVENSLGRLWSEGHPNFDKSNWKYYLDEAPQEPQVAQQLAELRKGYAALTPEDIKCIDPCMGSGHILAYLFDVLMQIYRSAGYTDRDAAASIVEHNLYGLDIDDRAAQMAYFVMMMKGCQYDSRFLRRHLNPHVYAIQESGELTTDALGRLGKQESTARVLLDGFKNAKEYGSILQPKVTLAELDALQEQLREVGGASDVGSLTDQLVAGQIVNVLYPLIEQAWMLVQKYDVVVTNPPYMGGSGMNARLSDYVKKYYPDSKNDLFAVFIEHGNEMVKRAGFNCMVTMQSWMFLSSFEKMRVNALQTKTITNLMHMENMVMGIAFGTAVTVFQNAAVHGYKGTYNQIKLQDIENDVPKQFPVSGNRFAQVSTDNFFKIPGSPVAYGLSQQMLLPYSIHEKLLGEVAAPCAGLATGDNNIFQRIWYEVKFSNIGFGVLDVRETENRNEKWYPCNSGGDFRKWSTDDRMIVNWQNNGKEIKAFKNAAGKLAARPQNTQWYFKEGLTWNKLSSSKFAVKYKRTGFIFDDTSRSAFPHDGENLNYLIGLLCSNVTFEYLKALNPTMSFTNGDLVRIPITVSKEKTEGIANTVENNISLSKSDWDSFETSWNFKKHPLLPELPLGSECVFRDANGKMGSASVTSIALADEYARWESECNKRFNDLKANEEELNRIFIDIYGLQDELTPEVEDKDVTVRRADLTREIKSLLSYAVGCMFGRYSLDVDGLVYAGGKWDDSKYTTFIPDADNVLPITDEEYFTDDIVGRFVEFVKVVYGTDTLEDNLAFIAKALGTKGTSPRAVIRNYFLNGFYADHVKIYQKRPIYWLYDSGKQNGFKALIYMHRYNADTSGLVRADYLYKMEQVYESEIARMDDAIANGTSREVAQATKRKEKLVKQLKECKDYDDRLGHIALARIPIDLDDGVKVNYDKVQTGADGKKLAILAKI